MRAWTVLSLALLSSLGPGCNVDPTGEDATLSVDWCVYGQSGDEGWCGLAGIETVQMIVNNEPVEEFTWPCVDGAYVSDGAVLGSGDYVIRFEGLDANGYAVATTHDPKVTEGDTVTVHEDDDVSLDADLDAGQVGDLDVRVRFEPAGGGEPTDCAGAGVARIGYEFFVDACGELRGEGVAVHLDDEDRGLRCADAGSLRLTDVPYGVYSLSVSGTDDDDTAWEGECVDLVLREGSASEDCTIPASR